MKRQTVARRSISKQAAQARRLIVAARRPSKFVVDATIQIDEYAGREVVALRAKEDRTIGTMVIPTGAVYFIVKSKVGLNRFYAARLVNDVWQTSIQDVDYRNLIIRKAAAYRQALLAEKVVA